MQREGSAAHRRALRPGGADIKRLRRQQRLPGRLERRWVGRRQRRAHGRLRGLRKQPRERTPALQRALQHRPLRYRLVDRRQRPPEQDRGRDHDPRGNRPLNRQPGAEAQHHRLQKQAQRARRHGERPAAVGGRNGRAERTVADRGEPLPHRRAHAKAPHRLAAGPHLLGQLERLGRSLPRLLLQPRRARLVHQRQHQEQHAGEHRQQAEHPVEQEQHGEEDRRPGRVEECEGTGTRRKALHRLEVGKPRRRRRTGLGRATGACEDRPQNPRVHPCLEPRPGARQHPRPEMIQQPHRQEQEGHDADQRHQRRLRPRTQHPVVDLKHEDRAGQHQQVHEGAEQPDRQERPPALGQRRSDLPRARRRVPVRPAHDRRRASAHMTSSTSTVYVPVKASELPTAM